MSVLLDTNLLTRIAEPNHPKNAVAADAVKWFLEKGKVTYILPQNAYEFWVVATINNGLGMSAGTAASKLDQLLRSVLLASDVPEIFPQWQRLVRDYDCKGKVAHDMRLVAGMIVHRIPTIITFNKADFIRIPEIQVLTPDEVLAQTF